MEATERFIVHIDMDAFFASIEERDEPRYKGKPVVVGANPRNGNGRGVVSACSYEARKFGIHSAMPISEAYRKCPAAIFLPVNMDKYAYESGRIFRSLEKFTPDIEPVSIDEAFIDITSSYHLFGTARETCLKIKTTIRELTGLACSLGLASNKMTAKIASDLAKPDGFIEVAPGKIRDFLEDLPAGRLWGIGEKTKQRLSSMGISTIGDLAKMRKEDLYGILGKWGGHLWELSRGIDPREVKPGDTIGSVSNEHTFSRDTSDKKEIMDTLMFLSEKVSRRLRKYGIKGRTVTLKIRFSDFSTHTRSISSDQATNFVKDIYENALKKTLSFDFNKKPVRLLGVRVSGLHDSAWQSDLFHENSEKFSKKERLHKALDKITEKFGDDAIHHRGVSGDRFSG